MRLKSFRVTNFRSIRDSKEVAVESGQTCLIGKNESGKTALLEALYRTNPVVPEHAVFDPVIDYPKNVFGYIEDVEKGVREDAVVVETNYIVDGSDKALVANAFGNRVLKTDVLTHYTYYCKPGSKERPKHRHSMELSERDAMRFLVRQLNVKPGRIELSSWVELRRQVASLSEDEVDEARSVPNVLHMVVECGGLLEYVVDKLLWPRAPKFMYFNEYYQMSGGENLERLLEREREGALQDSDHPLIGFMSLAGTNPEKLLNPTTTEDLRNRLTGASQQITRRVIEYWSQNRHLEIVFDVRQGNPQDPEEMRNAKANIWAMIRNTVHGGETPIDKRSRGFVWFFSFLAWYSHIRRQHGNGLILLLDEPGLSLHGKAQHDLLRYFENELSEHQVVYTTHSPFMFSIEHDKRLRIVQDRSIDEDKRLPDDQDGTKVISNLDDVWSAANGDTLFPLLTALGIELWQMDIVSKNRLIVEGKSDKDYLDAMSLLLERRGKAGLSRRWLVLQAGGKGRVSPIVSMFDAQKALNVAVLLDVDTENDGRVDALYKKRLLRQRNVLRVSQFTTSDVADIEDMFEREFYVDLVNETYAGEPGLDPSELPCEPRIIKAVEKAWNIKKHFTHGRPATYFSLHLDEFADSVSQDTMDRFERLFATLNQLLKD